jgi:hypothetical protein
MLLCVSNATLRWSSAENFRRRQTAEGEMGKHLVEPPFAGRYRRHSGVGGGGMHYLDARPIVAMHT